MWLICIVCEKVIEALAIITSIALQAYTSVLIKANTAT